MSPLLLKQFVRLSTSSSNIDAVNFVLCMSFNLMSFGRFPLDSADWDDVGTDASDVPQLPVSFPVLVEELELSEPEN